VDWSQRQGGSEDGWFTLCSSPSPAGAPRGLAYRRTMPRQRSGIARRLGCAPDRSINIANANSCAAKIRMIAPAEARHIGGGAGIKRSPSQTASRPAPQGS
jgi:hypothetical protein